MMVDGTASVTVLRVFHCDHISRTTEWCLEGSVSTVRRFN